MYTGGVCTQKRQYFGLKSLPPLSNIPWQEKKSTFSTKRGFIGEGLVVVTNIRFGLNFLRLSEILVKSSTQGRIPEYESIYCQLPNLHWPGRERSYCIRLLNWCAKIFLCCKTAHSKPVPHLPNDVISSPPTKELLAICTFRPNLQLFLEIRFYFE
jgi:hypothetical protein